MVDWLSSPEWETSFGALRDIECDDESGRCRAEVVPEEAQDPVYVIAATYRRSTMARIDAHGERGPAVLDHRVVLAAFLLSLAASFLTGVMLPVDGGLLQAL